VPEDEDEDEDEKKMCNRKRILNFFSSKTRKTSASYSTKDSNEKTLAKET